MQSHPRKLLTIITEAVLEATITRDIELLHARGYTITDARGKGRRGVRSAGWDANSNIRIEVACHEETADAIVAHLQEHYYQDYAMTVFVSDIQVLRPEKF
ncbi:transcriptional regulator [Pseudarthrobacter phenanthrenivorans]|jgi:nitrogen regulatory protein PII|uniref:Transcriptional regulator n=2 Tax=Pseudarthrobacter phenanthrenivorans TaxID=361575 RepID=A0A3B0FV17_PSEPS|nr:hypothetical protein [Pseudarthrobacter phenanthrenivorans]ADX74673.1 hypothetical protein Asphe3_35720 [Pseudarthrobacter phenanthrenivorans Sphe3]RKO23689.1 transcriptional regulator [Pseudarthrobacter phenanthrenivorans]TPV50549.1 transcriptional regulator [Pseudarthrobacter phenanthrenivorans]